MDPASGGDCDSQLAEGSPIPRQGTAMGCLRTEPEELAAEEKLGAEQLDGRKGVLKRHLSPGPLGTASLSFIDT